jgi:hypothetical protein
MRISDINPRGIQRSLGAHVSCAGKAGNEASAQSKLANA